MQDTFVRAFERRASFDGRSSPGTWLHRILHNLAIDHMRRNRHEIPADEVEALWREDDYSVDAATVTEAAETRQELEDALVRLPFIYRAVLVLHDIEGWTVAEIADRLEIGLPAAKQRLRRGRMMLVSALAAGAERRGAMAGVPLRCWDARHLVSEYMNDDLTPGERAAVEDHLRGCPTCPPLYAGLVGAREALGRLRDPDSVIPPDLARRVAERASQG